MTNDKFLQYVGERINEEKEYLINLESRLEKAINSGDEELEIQRISFEINKLKKKIDLLEEIKDLPKLARVFTMSDDEVLKKKDDLVKELESKKLSSPDDCTIDWELEALEESSIEEIKSRLLDGMSYSKLESIISSASREFSDFEMVCVNFGVSYDNAKYLTLLLSKYRYLENKSENVTSELSINSYNSLKQLPELYNKVLTYGDKKGNYREDELEGILDSVIEYRNTFAELNNVFKHEFSLAKLSDLIGREDNVITDTNVDWQFIMSHSGKYDENLFEELRRCVDSKRELSCKLIKGKKTKEQIMELNERILVLLNKIYKSIISWYKNFDFKKLGVVSNLDLFFTNHYSELSPFMKDTCGFNENINVVDLLNEQLISISSKIGIVDEDLTGLLNDVNMKTSYCHTGKEVYIVAMNRIREEIINSSFMAPCDLEVTCFSSDEETMDMCMDLNVTYNINRVINDVVSLAQNLSDKEEAKINCISIDQLLSLKKFDVGKNK